MTETAKPKTSSDTAPLYECHGHIMMNGASFSAARELHTEQIDTGTVHRELQALSDAGVVYFRDGGDALGVSKYARKIAFAYGIEYVTPVFAIHRNGRYGSIVGRSYTDLTEYLKLMSQVRAEGGDFIKLMFSGIITFRQYGELSCPSLPAGEIQILVRLAHDAGFPVMAHVNGDETIRAAILAGTDSIEHGAFMSDDTAALLADSETVWVPTAAAIAAFTRRDGAFKEAAGRTLAEHLSRIRFACEKGAVIAAGSDSGAVGVPHGEGTREEYRLLHQAGLSETAITEGSRRLADIFKKKETCF